MNPYIILKPIITEKSLKAAKQGIYTFEVDRNANKPEIRKAIQAVFGVHVVSVHTIMRGPHYVRKGVKRNKVLLPRTKKALVSLRQGEKIELFDIEGEK